MELVSSFTKEINISGLFWSAVKDLIMHRQAYKDFV